MHEKFRGSLVKSYLIECLSTETVTMRGSFTSPEESTLLGVASVPVDVHIII